MELDELKMLADEIENLVFQYAKAQVKPPIPGNLAPTKRIELASVECSEEMLEKAIKWAGRAVEAEAKRMEIATQLRRPNQ